MSAQPFTSTWYLRMASQETVPESAVSEQWSMMRVGIISIGLLYVPADPVGHVVSHPQAAERTLVPEPVADRGGVLESSHHDQVGHFLPAALLGKFLQELGTGGSIDRYHLARVHRHFNLPSLDAPRSPYPAMSLYGLSPKASVLVAMRKSLSTILTKQRASSICSGVIPSGYRVRITIPAFPNESP